MLQKKRKSLSFDSIIIDEYQDLTPLQFLSLLDYLPDSKLIPLYLYGDENQSVNPTIFSLSKANQLLYSHFGRPISIDTHRLSGSYRTGPSLLGFINGMKAIKDTLLIACIGTPLGGLLAVLVGYVTTRLKVRGRKSLETASLLNYTLPGTVVGIAYIIAFNDKPIVLTGTIYILIAAYVFRYSSAGIRNVIAALSQIDPSIEEASRSLGASSVKTFTSITIPLVLPAVLAGMKYLFIHSMTAISATIFLVSVHWTLITTRILECMTELQFAQACAFSIILILLVFAASGLMSLLARVLCRNGGSIGAH